MRPVCHRIRIRGRRSAAALAVLSAVLAGAVPAGAATSPPSFSHAQQLARSGKRVEAQGVCREILDRQPDHLDARVLLGQVLAWDKRYPEARRELEEALARRPDYLDASRALADVELWDHRPEQAIAVCDAGLAHHPQDGELLYRKARALESLERNAEARAIADSLTRVEPDDPRYRRLSRRLTVQSMTTEAQVGYRYEDFREFSDPWEEWNLSVRFKQRWGSLIPRVRHARRFGDDGQQFEVDAYPRFPHRMYAYLNAGYSDDRPFPDLRLGAELYKNFAGGWEASVGGRYLDFETTEVRIYTGTVGKYWRNWWFSARPTVTDKQSGNSDSIALRFRRYFGGSQTYVGLEGSVGDAPAFDLAGFEQGRLESSRLRLEGQVAFAGIWALEGSVGRRDQEFVPGSSRESTVYSLSLSRLF